MGRKRTLNKNEVIVASSLVAIPLTAILLIAMLTRRSKNRPLKRSTSSRQASLKANKTILNNTTIITRSHHQQMEEEEEEQEEKAQSEPESPRQGIKTEEVTATPVSTTATTTISANNTTSTPSTPNDITIPAPLAVVAPSPMEPSNSVGSAMIPSPSQAPKEQELSISDEARKAGQSLKELIASAIKDAKESTKGSGKGLKEETGGIEATSDSKDVRSFGENLNTLVGLFEKTMVEIRKEHYDEQIKLLQSYRDLLQTHLKVVSTRGTMASKLKPGD